MKTSVLINNYNYGRFLDDCLKSLTSQSDLPDEIILYDDGSNDNSLEVAKKYKEVKIISKKNYGKKPSFNQGNAIYKAFLESSGDIIFLLDSDDFFDHRKVEVVKSKFQSNDNLVLVQNAFFQWKNNKIDKILDYSIRNTNYLELYYKRKWTGFFNPTSCLAFRRSYIKKVLPIIEDSNWRVWPDVRLSRMAPFYGEVECVSIPLTYYRKHGGSDSDSMNRNYQKIFKNQKEHHEYLNSQILDLGGKELEFRNSSYYLKYFIKAKLEKFLP